MTLLEYFVDEDQRFEGLYLIGQDGLNSQA